MTVLIGIPGVHFTPKEILLLQALRDAGGIVPFERLSEIGWPHRRLDCEGNVIKVTICRLRRKLEGSGFEIAGDRQIGYWLLGDAA